MLLLLLLPWAGAKRVEVPLDIGLGPAIHGISGPVREDQLWHYGARLSLEAIVDNKTIRKFKNRIPPQYRELALSLDEVRIRPLWFLLPKTVYLSPATERTGVWGASWELVGLGVPLVRTPFRLAPEVGIPLTWMNITSTALPTPTNFVRLGLEGGVDLEVPITPGFLLSAGWASQLHIPQELGGGVFEVGPKGTNVWHIGQAYAEVHVRVPVTVNL